MNDLSCKERKTDDEQILSLLVVFSAVLLLVRLVPHLLSDLWYDEVVTLADFAIGPSHANSILHVFRSYPVANNHVLFSAISWLWVRILHFNAAEYLLRLPSLLFAFLTLFCIVWQWRKWLGVRVAGYAGLFLASSPVFAGFACQFRGYSLSILLGTLAVTGTMELASGSYRRGLLYCVPVALLLPLVIPTNALLVIGHLIFLLCWCWPDLSLGRRLKRLLPVAVGLGLGCAFYLTIWPQFTKAAAQTAGWSSSWPVAGNLALAMLAHSGPLALLFALKGFSLPWWRRRVADAGGVLAWRLFASCMLPVLLVLLLLRSAPFPRVFLVFLPTFSFCIMLTFRELKFWRDGRILLVVGLVVMHGFLWDRATTQLTEWQLGAGRHPQNLLQQYYRSSSALSDVARWARQDNGAERLLVVTDAYDFPTLRYYWGLVGLPQANVLAENRHSDIFRNDAFPQQEFKISVLAANEQDAARLFEIVGAKGAFELAFRTQGRGLYLQRGADALQE